jgi:hypothetical protein
LPLFGGLWLFGNSFKRRFAAAAKAQEAVTYLDGLQSATAHSFAA